MGVFKSGSEILRERASQKATGHSGILSKVYGTAKDIVTPNFLKHGDGSTTADDISKTSQSKASDDILGKVGMEGGVQIRDGGSPVKAALQKGIGTIIKHPVAALGTAAAGYGAYKFFGNNNHAEGQPAAMTPEKENGHLAAKEQTPEKHISPEQKRGVFTQQFENIKSYAHKGVEKTRATVHSLAEHRQNKNNAPDIGTSLAQTTGQALMGQQIDHNLASTNHRSPIENSPRQRSFPGSLGEQSRTSIQIPKHFKEAA